MKCTKEQAASIGRALETFPESVAAIALMADSCVYIEIDDRGGEYCIQPDGRVETLGGATPLNQPAPQAAKDQQAALKSETIALLRRLAEQESDPGGRGYALGMAEAIGAGTKQTSAAYVEQLREAVE